MDNEKKDLPEEPQKKPLPETWVTDMKEDMEEYFEEQMVYIRQ